MSKDLVHVPDACPRTSVQHRSVPTPSGGGAEKVAPDLTGWSWTRFPILAARRVDRRRGCRPTGRGAEAAQATENTRG
jgi:hypothetical protein